MIWQSLTKKPRCFTSYLKNTLKKKEKKPKKKTTSQLKKELDKVFSQFIRQKYANKDGMVACYTCGVTKHWKEMQNGHFASRSYLATRFDETNVRVQCVGCNVFGGGRVAIFATRLEAEGISTKELYRKAQQITKYFPYEDKIEEYKLKLKDYE